MTMTTVRLVAIGALLLAGCAAQEKKLPRFPDEAKPFVRHINRAIAQSAKDGYEIRGSFASAMNAVYKASPSTRTDGDFDTLNMNATGALHVSIQENAASGTSSSKVQGTAADGAAAVGNPVQVAGKDDSGNIQAVRMATTGEVAVIGAQTDGGAVAGNPVLMGGQDGTNTQSVKTDSTGSVQVDVESMPADATELPAAAALSDALANPTTPLIGSASLAWDGTQWLRSKGDATSGLYVQAHSPRVKTYRATFNVAAGAAGTAVEVLGPTSGSSEILEIYLTKPSAAVTLTINKRSAASTGGTAGTAPTLVPNDATFAAATSVVKIFTGDPTEGTLVGEVFRRTFATTDDVSITYGTGIDGPFTLNAVAQALTIETSAAATIVGHVVFLER